MYTLKMMRFEIGSFVSGTPAIRSFKVNPNLQAILAVAMTTTQSQNVICTRHACIRTRFLDGHTVQAMRSLFLLQVFQFASMPMRTSTE